jgi:hypothetical protein
MRLSILAAGALLPLAACNTGPSTEDSAKRTGDIRLENASMEEVVKQTVAAQGKTRAQPGEWENSYQLVALDLNGVPEPVASQMKSELGKPPHTTRICKKAEDAQAIDFSKLSTTQQGCRFPKYLMAGGKIDAKMECDAQFGKMRMAITGTQTPTGYDVTMTQSQAVPGQNKESSSTVRLTGKRVGDCKA